MEAIFDDLPIEIFFQICDYLEQMYVGFYSSPTSFTQNMDPLEMLEVFYPQEIKLYLLEIIRLDPLRYYRQTQVAQHQKLQEKYRRHNARRRHLMGNLTGQKRDANYYDNSFPRHIRRTEGSPDILFNND